MEALIFILDSAAMVAMVVLALRNERHRASKPEIGPFRYIDCLPIVTKPSSSRWQR